MSKDRKHQTHSIEADLQVSPNSGKPPLFKYTSDCSGGDYY